MSAENKKTLQYINEYYDNQKTESEIAPQEIFEMIEQMMAVNNALFAADEKINDAVPEFISEEKKEKVDVKKFMATALAAYQVPSEQAGKPGTEEQKKFQFHITKHIGRRSDKLEDKLAIINKFARGEVMDPNASIATILSHCGVLSILASMIADFNPSAAGFAFEAFLAALLYGEQIADPEGGSLPIEDAVFYIDKEGRGSPASLKLLNPTTVVEGSLNNLLEFLRDVDKKMWYRAGGESGEYPYVEYIVAIKHSEKILGFYSFTISPHNFFDWIQEGYFDWNRVNLKKRKTKKKKGEEDELELQERDYKRAKDYTEKEIKTLEDKVNTWKDLVSNNYLPFLGFEPWDKESKQYKSLSLSTFIPSASGYSKLGTVMHIIQTALSREEDFKKNKDGIWSGISNDAYFDNEDIIFYNKMKKIFKDHNNPSYKDMGRQATKIKEGLGSMLARLSLRRDFLIKYMDEVGPTHNLFMRPLATLAAIMHGGEGPMIKPLEPAEGSEKGRKLLQSLLNKGDYKSWAQALLNGLTKKKKFHIPNKSVRGGGRLDTKEYGSLEVDKKAVHKLIQTYSEKLLVICAPIYESLGDLTENINTFFLGRTGVQKSTAAIKAEKNAIELSKHAEKLRKIDQEG